MPKRKKNEAGSVLKPLLRFDRVIYEKATFRLRQITLQQIYEYVCYVKEMTGGEPPSDELVDRGMQRLFDADRGFREWLQRRDRQEGIGINPARASEPATSTVTEDVSVPLAQDLAI